MTRALQTVLILGGAVAGGLTGLAGRAAVPSPLSPADALQSFQLEDGLVAECVAAEPLVESPCAIAWDRDGSMWVVENRGYPNRSNPPRGRIARLVDDNGDGRFDRRVEFAADLSFPNGLMPWRDGLLVTCAPDVIFFRDGDGDGSAEIRDVRLTGFSVSQSTQLRVNDPTARPGGWIAFAGGLSGGKVRDVTFPESTPVDLTGGDLEWHPESGRLRVIDGKSQWGHEFDDYGRRFACMNRIQVQHVVLESRYLRRNRHLAFSDIMQNCPEEMLKPISGGEPPAARLYPLSDNQTIKDAHQGTFSAAGAITLWRAGALPARYDGKVFSCDPSANLVHWDELIPAGATFVARRSPEHREFMASRDNWFRPVFLARGPDGALYVVDMYRKVIDHPDYMPQEIRKRTDYAAGEAMGRIWRVRASTPRQPPLPPAGAPGPAPDASDPGWREAWLREAEPRLRADTVLRDRAFALAADPDPRVRFQAALSLGEAPDDPRLSAVLSSIARAAPNDRWTRAAVLSSAGSCAAELLGKFLETPLAPPTLVEETARLAAASAPENVAGLLVRAVGSTISFDAAAALCLGLGKAPADTGQLTDNATRRATDAALDLDARVRATAFLALAGGHDEVLIGLVRPAQANAIQVAAIRGLRGRLAPLFTSDRWAECSPFAREVIISESLAHPAAAAGLLDALESQAVPLSALTPARRQALAKNPQPDVAARAQKLFAAAGGGDREAVFRDYKERALPLDGDPANGRTLFAIHCATCHRLDRVGVAVGPDLFDIRNQPPETILMHLLIPDREISPGFNTYVVTTKDNRTLAGIVASESPAALTLRLPAGIEESLLRSQIVRLESRPQSLMPTGLEAALSPQQMADLLAHLRGE